MDELYLSSEYKGQLFYLNRAFSLYDCIILLGHDTPNVLSKARLFCFFVFKWRWNFSWKSTLKDLQKTVHIFIFLWAAEGWSKHSSQATKRVTLAFFQGYFWARRTRVKTWNDILFSLFFLNHLDLQAAILRDTGSRLAGNTAFFFFSPCDDLVQRKHTD